MSESHSAVDVPGYALEGVVGRGATATVWSGRDGTGHPVAVKVPHLAGDDVDAAQCATERHVLTALRHEHLVAVRDVVALADGRAVTVFDLVAGATLRSTVDARGQLRPGEAVTILTPLCDAVTVLHAAGVTHGDISPGNVLLTANGRPMLADLGAAFIAGSGAGLLGTHGFVAPEVRAGLRPTPSSDVFSLGALAWFALTGNGAPDTPLRLSAETISSHVGPELAQVVGECIDPDPTRRPDVARLGRQVYAATPAEPVEVVVGADVATALTHRLRLNAASSPPAPARAGEGRCRSVLGALRRHPLPRRRAVLAAVALAGLLAFGGLAWPDDDGPGDATVSRTPPWTQGPVSRSLEQAVTDPGAPRRTPEALMRDLAERRVNLLVARDTSALRTVHREGSPSWTADHEVLTELERGGQRYVGLRVAAVAAETVSAAEGRAVVRAKVGLTAYDVVDESGHTTHRPARAGQELDFSLVMTAQGWRIESLDVPAAT